MQPARVETLKSSKGINELINSDYQGDDMTPSELKYHVEKTGEYFFSRSSMKFFGDSMKNYGVRSATIICNYDEKDQYHAEGIITEVWELYRKQPVKKGLKGSVYFRRSDYSKTFARGEK